MKDAYYVLQTEINGEKYYLTIQRSLTKDIRKAAKCVNKLTALFLNEDYQFECDIKNYIKRDFKTILVKVTYDWEE